MNDLEKDLAIYKAMYGFANELFTNACDASEKLRKAVSNCSNVVSSKQLMKKGSDLYSAFYDATSGVSDVCHIEIGTFECSFKWQDVFYHLEVQKQLAKVKGEILFTYEEKIDLPLVTTVDFTFDNVTAAKKLPAFAANDELRPVLNCVLAEVNLDTEIVSFVATDGHAVAVITTDNFYIHRNNPNDHVLRALFAKKDWDRICDYAKKNGNAITLDFYLHDEKQNQSNDTAVAHCGDQNIKSIMQDSCRYPNWHSVMPFLNGYKRIRLTEEGSSQFAQYVKNDKNDFPFHYTVSIEEGCNELCIEWIDYDFSKTNSVKFPLESPAEETAVFGLAKRQMKKFTTLGFWYKDNKHPFYFDSKEYDAILAMPVLVEGSAQEPEPVEENVEETVEVEAEACVAA